MAIYLLLPGVIISYVIASYIGMYHFLLRSVKLKKNNTIANKCKYNANYKFVLLCNIMHIIPTIYEINWEDNRLTFYLSKLVRCKNKNVLIYK